MIQVNSNGWASCVNCGVTDQLLLTIEGHDEESLPLCDRCASDIAETIMKWLALPKEARMPRSLECITK